MKRIVDHYVSPLRACGHNEDMTLRGTDQETAQQFAAAKRTPCSDCADTRDDDERREDYEANRWKEAREDEYDAALEAIWES